MKRDDETVTQFTMRKIREEIIEECAKVADDMAAAQQATNAKYPEHAAAYPTWRNAVHCYQDAARQIRKLTNTPAVGKSE